MGIFQINSLKDQSYTKKIAQQNLKKKTEREVRN